MVISSVGMHMLSAIVRIQPSSIVAPSFLRFALDRSPLRRPSGRTIDDKRTENKQKRGAERTVWTINTRAKIGKRIKEHKLEGSYNK